MGGSWSSVAINYGNGFLEWQNLKAIHGTAPEQSTEKAGAQQQLSTRKGRSYGDLNPEVAGGGRPKS